MQYLQEIITLSVVCDKHRTINILMIIIMLRETRNLEYDIPQSWDCAIIPTHSKATKTDIQHFNVYSPAFRDVDLTIGYRWCL